MNIAQNCQNLAVGGYNVAELRFSAEADDTALLRGVEGLSHRRQVFLPRC
jgi:hypothetical protein